MTIERELNGNSWPSGPVLEASCARPRFLGTPGASDPEHQKDPESSAKPSVYALLVNLDGNTRAWGLGGLWISF